MNMDNNINKITLKYLPDIHTPKDLKNISDSEMGQLADEIRNELIRVVSENGGHLASNLGVVELTMAIHRVFDAPKDHIIFDVGHQSYIHKMLTGRYDKFDTLRQAGGISGFTNRKESEYDCFGAGHSSTSLSAALGFAISDKLNNSDAYTIVVIGDGAYTGGMIHEALNNCRKDLKLIIIMNENEMSISKNIGRFAENLSKIRTKSGYFKTKKATGAFLKKIPLVGKTLFWFFRGIKKTFKNVLYGSNYFESMGLTYLGPIDGNDYHQVANLLTEAKKLNESVVLHVKTKKGKGFLPAEAAPDIYHGMSPISSSAKKRKTFSKVMGEHLTDIGEKDEAVCAITAAMCDGTGLDTFRSRLPLRFFDVGIAEEHALTFAAGLAANGKKPLVAIYSTFLQRGYDNIIHDIALQNLPVVICIDRAGLNPNDGATHHGIFDVAFLSQIPGIKIYTPIFNRSLEKALDEAFKCDGPAAIRYPNGCENEEILSLFNENKSSFFGVKTSFSTEEKIDVVIVTYGNIVNEALKAKKELNKDGVSVGIILLEMLKPYGSIAREAALHIPDTAKGVIFLEEEIKSGGMGMNLQEALKKICPDKMRVCEIMATDDSFVSERNSEESIYDAAHISAKYIYQTAIKIAQSCSR